MLSRYETGPVATTLYFLSALGLCVVGIVDAVRFHHAQGWVIAAVSVLPILVFDQRYRRKRD